MTKTRKNKKSYVRGWSKQQPSYKQRTNMFKKCGQRCFLGPKKSFPICTKNTCKINKRGVMAAYMRAKEYKHSRIASKAKKMLGGAVEQNIYNNPKYLPNEKTFGPLIDQQVARQQEMEQRQRRITNNLRRTENRVVDDTLNLLQAHNNTIR